MANNKPNTKIKIKQNEVIENNIKLIEILFFIFEGQVLDLDLKEFCLKHSLYQTEGQYSSAIKNLISNNIIKIKKLVNTNNNVLIAKAPIYNFFNLEGKTTRYSVETVTRNSYTNYILINKINLDLNDDVQDIVNFLKDNTTLLSKKRDVESCYKAFNPKLSSQGKDAKLDALYREEKRKASLKNIEQVELIERQGIKYTETLQTLRERDIYVTCINNQYKFYITDNNSTYILSNLSNKIGLLIKVLIEQVEIDNIETLDILILVKDSYSKKRLENNFITKYKENEKINIDTAINDAVKKYECSLNIDYTFMFKNTNELYKLQNTYKDTLPILRLKIVNTDIAHKHNSDMRAKALVQYQQEKKERTQRGKIIEELKEKGLLR